MEPKNGKVGVWGWLVIGFVCLNGEI